MDISFPITPDLFGPLHLSILAAALFGTASLFFVLRKMSENRLLRLIFLLGISMLLLEVWKQWFVARYLFPGQKASWFFPWQLCSMAMYCGALLPVLKGKLREAVLVFLCSYSMLAALVALILPYDMLRPQILLFFHGFLYHAAMLVMSLAAVFLLKQEKKVSFLPAVFLFSGMTLIAEIINVISHAVIRNPSLEANMFYITPYYPSTQPVFHEIAVRFGIPFEILLYLGVITLGSFGLYQLQQLFFRRSLRAKPDQ